LILVQWSCDVPDEELESFIRFCRDELKPFYESHGCKRFELFILIEVRKRYFSYQTTQKGNRYTEQLIFNAIEEFENLLEVVESDSHAKEIIESYGKKFHVSSCNFTILTQKI